ncbi:cupin domain-containing protein [Brevundimonas sp.]|uniref:cupin domain-containing protein n=1 Tax=Brevundimonas sp. TaxID=1871086 RepID=UPI00262CC15F|nr:cupin domain-containing protein [Brevundimonas sp.]
MPKIDIDAAPERNGTAYPPPFDAPCRERRRRRLGNAAGLSQFGVNRLILPPGGWSSQRHWHTAEDEFVWILSGEVVLVENEGETVLRAGDCAGFPKGVANGHQLVNRSEEVAVVLEVGGRNPDQDAVDYPDIDLMIAGQGDTTYRHKDGTPYETAPGRVK